MLNGKTPLTNLFPEQSGVEQSNDKRTHFTYKQVMDKNTLCQGDVLKITDKIKNVLQEIHPYFLNEQYKYFMVLTQSCDLVRRDGVHCKTPYITLAAVRDFDEFFEKHLQTQKYAEKVSGYLLVNNRQKDRAYQFLERIYNNTESDYFFLYKDESLSFPKSMIASLKVSIALKSELHYTECLEAKALELSDEFKAKLGWLIGNIYSRVGTTDWESILTSKARTDMLNSELQNHCIIGTNDQIRELKKELTDHADRLQTPEDVNAFILNCHIASRYEKVMDEVERILKSSARNIPTEEIDRLIRTLRSRSSLKTLIPNI